MVSYTLPTNKAAEPSPPRLNSDRIMMFGYFVLKVAVAASTQLPLQNSFDTPTARAARGEQMLTGSRVISGINQKWLPLRQPGGFVSSYGLLQVSRHGLWIIHPLPQ